MSSHPQSTLAGKRAFVTGGSRGIGAAIVRQLAAAGADLAFTYEHSADKAVGVRHEIEAAGRRGLAVQADNADAAAIKAAIGKAAGFLGGLDILVNSAGIIRAAPLEELSLADIDATLAVNVKAVIIASQAAVVHMGEGGRIISIGSCLAERVDDPNLGLYALSKAALIGWTRGLARELGPRGITVNIVHPGPTDTDMNPASGPHAQTQRARIALGHYGKPEDIAGTVAFLAGEGGRFITGAGLSVDGGINA